MSRGSAYQIASDLTKVAAFSCKPLLSLAFGEDRLLRNWTTVNAGWVYAAAVVLVLDHWQAGCRVGNLVRASQPSHA